MNKQMVQMDSALAEIKRLQAENDALKASQEAYLLDFVDYMAGIHQNTIRRHAAIFILQKSGLIEKKSPALISDQEIKSAQEQ